MQLLASLAQFPGQGEPTTLPPSSASSHEALGTTLGCRGSHTQALGPQGLRRGAHCCSPIQGPLLPR